MLPFTGLMTTTELSRTSSLTHRSERLPMRALAFAAALGTAAMGGVFYAFSSFVMAGLDRLPAAQAVAAMQSINITAVRPAFMAGLFGTAALCLLLAVRAVLSWGHRSSVLLLVGALLYLGGAILLTAGYHVPLNDRLARLDPNSAAAATQWHDYVRGWTLLNHVRAAAALGAAAAFIAAVRWLP
ncbi:DUF1772 domain-containing protein [Acidothermaceae bacterium B102]|nr:DUF1772 domain-containing protein [Acidothermaceae bacterium B102]